MAGLAIGVSSMKSGECALVHVGWELAYGKEGNFSFPNVPNEVEVIGFDETKEASYFLSPYTDNSISFIPTSLLTSDLEREFYRGRLVVIRIGAADRRKMDGNSLFKEDKLEEAMQQYEMVLTEEEKNPKALFRRGKAKAELRQIDSARDDFRKAQKYAPDDKAIRRELRALAEQEKAMYQKQKEMYKGMFKGKEEKGGAKAKRRNWLILLWQWLVLIFCIIFRRYRVKAD